MVWHKGLDRTGRPLGYNERVAISMNWWRRILLGTLSQLGFHSGYFIIAEPGYKQMSLARKLKYAQMMQQKQIAEKEVKKLIEMIEDFHNSPIDLEREAKGIKPRRRKKDPLPAQETGSNALPSA
jgi:hypothetical protein